MRRLQQLSMAVVFTLMLSTGAFAGIMEAGKTDDPPPDPPPASAPESAPATPSDQQNSVASSNSVMDATLSLLQSLLSRF